MTPRSKKILIASVMVLTLALAGLGGIIGFSPVIIKAQLPALMNQAIGQPASVDNVGLSLMPLSLRMKNFTLGAEHQQPVVALDAVYLEIDPGQSLAQKALVIKQLLIDKPFIRVSKNKNGKLNVVALFGPTEPHQSTDNKLFPVRVSGLSIHDGKLVYDDAQHPHLNATLFPLKLAISDFSTYGGQPADINLSLTLDTGAQLNWTGNVGIAPIRSQGKLKLTGLDLKKTLAFADIDFLTGSVDTEADYQADYNDQELKLVINKIKLKARDLGYRQQNLSIHAASLNHQAQLTLNQKNDQFNLVIDDAQFSFQDLRLQHPDVAMALTQLDHETELSLTETDARLQITAKSAKATARQLGMQAPLVATAEKLVIDAPYRLALVGGDLDFLVKQAGVSAAGLQILQPENQQPAITIATLKAGDINFDLAGRQLDIGTIAIDAADSQAVLNADGGSNYQKLLSGSGSTATTNSEQPVTEKKTWQVAAQTLTLTNSAVSFTDQTLNSPTTLDFKPINLTLTGYHSQKSGLLPVMLEVGVDGGGSIKLNGDLGLTPLTAKLDVTVKNIDLEKFKNYVSQFVRLNLIDGRTNLTGKLNLNGQQPLALTFNGNASIANLLTRDQRVFKDFVKWKNLSLTGITVDTSANRYTASRLNLDKPYARVTIRKDKSINFDNLLITGNKTSKPDKPAPVKKPAPLYFKLDQVNVTGGSSNFSDFSLILPFSAYIEDLQGGAKGVSSEIDSTIKLTLSGNAYDLAPVNITGTLSPYLGDYDIQLDFQGLPMPLVSPYMVQFAGYKVERGKLSLTLNYKVADNKLSADNKILIDQFELGEKLENPNAVSLPLKLAVALLKDSNGRIKFDVPITGSLENPEFSLGAVIAEALGNAIGKIIRSPFSLLASLTDSDDDLSSISFNPGDYDLKQPQTTKLNGLAAALTERPALTLGIKGVAYQRQDWPALRDDALYDQLKERRAQELNKNAAAKTRAEYVTLSDDDYRRLLADMFIEKFPALAEKSFLGAPRLKSGQTADFYEVAKQKLMKVIHPERQRLKDLAVARARAIAKYLVKYGKVSQNQLFILDPLVDQEKDEKPIPSSLSLQSD